MSGFITALIKQRKDAKNAEPDTSGRLKEILGILKKYDYSDGFTPEILVGIIQDLGPTFVKIGQIASQQSEYIPPEYCNALAKLRSRVAPMNIETVRSQIEKHLGKPVDELFASFDEKPLGSASIAQVHRAELFDGTVVAVKVRRPGVVDLVARDFALIEKVLDTFFKNGIGGMDIKGFILELEKTSKTELDFTNEAANLERFWENNLGRPCIESPKCYREYTNDAILTEDFVTGKEVSDTDYLDTLSDDERDRLAALVADNFATQILVDGFYHADPHSGNVLIKEATPGSSSEQNNEDTVVESKLQLPEHHAEWIDFGMMGVLTVQQRQTLIDLVTSVVMQDAYNLKRTVLKVAQPQGDIDHGALLEMCETMSSQYTGSEFGDFDLGDLLGTVLGNLEDENYKIDPFLTNLARGVIAIEGTIKTLSPRVNILNYFTDKVDIGLDFDIQNLDRNALEAMTPKIVMKLVQNFDNVSKSSSKTAEALDMLEKGQLKIRTEFSFEDKALMTVNRIAGYAIRALMIIALFIGSCLLCTAPVLTTDGVAVTVAFPALGLVGCVVSLFFAYRLYQKMKKDE
ncbi:MAG: AarF/ABC1/UbiB kinase family protein [Coriobacteriales bacterium]|nr:AarF/ABC1/UbiB kinase family protein [Coriobacteriales bacterium]